MTVMIALLGCEAKLAPSESYSTPTIIPTSLIATKSSATTPVPTEALNSLENWDAAKNCITVFPTRPNGYELTGVLALRFLSSTTLGLSLSLLNLENNTSTEIPTPNPVDFAYVSPGRKTLGYLWFNNATSKWELTLLNSAGEQKKVAWSSKEAFGFDGMLDDQRVVINEGTTYIVVVSFLGSHENFSSLDFPDFDTNNMHNFFVSFDANLIEQYINTLILLFWI